MQPPGGALRTVVAEVNINTAVEVIAKGHHLGIWVITAQLNINHEAVCQILTTKLGMKCVCVRGWVRFLFSKFVYELAH